MKIILVLVCLFISAVAWANRTPAESEAIASQIKSCLVDLYIAQQKHFESHAIYANSVDALKVSEKAACKGIQISSEVADKENFLLVGKSKGEQWTLDESKSLTQIQ